MTHEAKLYLEGKTVHEIGRIIGLSGAGVWKRLKKQGITLRTPTPKGRPWAIKKRGLEFKGADGRWWVRGIRSSNKRTSKRRAVVVMEGILGHSIPKGYHVHHLDGNIENDNPDNLSLKLAGEHSSIHGVGKNPKKNAWKGDRKRKITPPVKEKIIELRSRGMSQSNIASELSLHQTTIGKVLNNILVPNIK